MTKQTIKSDFESMMRTFGCANVTVRYGGSTFDGLLPIVSTERRLMMQGADPSWSGTIYIRRENIRNKEIKSGETIEVKRESDQAYRRYRVGSPSDYAEAFIAINLESQHRG
jgi:hypothetical protein